MSKSRYISSRFGDLFAPNSIAELIDIIISPPQNQENLVRMWRGQADISWRVDSSAFRRLSVEYQPPANRELIWYENQLLKRATHRGFRVHNGMVLSDFDLLARLQHHGAATRLVDATRSALVGLYFACSSHSDKTGVLLGFNAYYLGGYEGEPNTREYEMTVESLEKFQHPQTWEPPLVSPRIAAQHSQFLYSAISISDFGSLHLSAEDGALIGIAIIPAMKPKFLKVLSETFDIRTETMFPDIDGFGIANRSDIPPSNSYRW